MKKSEVLLIVVLFFVCIVTTPDNLEKRTVLLLSFDGMRWDSIVNVQGFDFLKKNGFSANKCKSVFPSLTFPAHSSIATGTFPRRNGIISSSFLERKGNIRFSDEKEAVWQNEPPIWYFLEKNDLKTAVLKWPLSQGGYNGIFPSYNLPYSSNSSDNETLNFIFDLLKKKYDRPNLIMAWFSGADHSGHTFGPKSNEYRSSVLRSGQIIENLLKEIEKDNLKDKVILMVTSDHGMTDVKGEVDIVSKIPKKGFFPYIAISGPLANIYFENSRQKVETTNSLKSFKRNFIFFNQIEVPSEISLGSSSRVGDIVAICDFGFIFKPFRGEREILRGMHGYDPSYPDIHGIFLAYGKGVAKSEVEEVNLVDIAPTILKIFGLEKSNNFDGKALF